ncbi:hypothetical protein HUJ05_000499 [Dendroctonus ponderosae]|nr:hypothetical protein HUJ05_000499 [Dendroctonus ponderosae]
MKNAQISDSYSIIGAAIFALCLWLRFEPGINEWLTILNASNFYIGIYILVIVAAIIMVVSFLGCLSSLQENATIILGNHHLDGILRGTWTQAVRENSNY